MLEEKLKPMSEEQKRVFIAEEIKKKLQELDELKKISRELVNPKK